VRGMKAQVEVILVVCWRNSADRFNLFSPS
jgi:hypothetical protein